LSYLFQKSDKRIGEKCAVFGAYNIGPKAARIAYNSLLAMQHRGQEHSGIISVYDNKFYRHSASGLVSNVYSEEDIERLIGDSAIGHNRYSTSGTTDNSHAQPILHRDSKFAFAHNGNIPDTEKLEAFLQAHNISTSNLNDSEIMAAAIEQYMKEGSNLDQAITQSFSLFTGSFSAVALSTNQLIAFRDQCGIRPLSIGRLGDGYVIASETCAFDVVGAQYLRDVRPGEVVIIDRLGITSRQVVKSNSKLDIFELIYFAHPDSVIDGMSVNQIRQNLGKELAMQYKIDADIVVPVPDSAIPAAKGYAEKSGIPYEIGLIKNNHIHRTFIQPNQILRERDVELKFKPLEDVIKNKRIILIDDSIVRGTTAPKIAKLMYGAGARTIHLLVSSPPVIYPDFYGIDLPRTDELIAANLNLIEIRQHIGVDSLGYLSYDGMIRATGRPASYFSTSCFNGVYPIPIGKRAPPRKLSSDIDSTFRSDHLITNS
jgi:amidophosphoribosyltransferase